jgi:hypothetical protein
MKKGDMKKVISRVVKSSPFIEQRLRNDLQKNKYRRAEDTQPQNFMENHVIRPITYKITTWDLEPFNNTSSGRFFDYYV